MEIARLESQLRKEEEGAELGERMYTVPSQMSSPLHFAVMPPSPPREFTFDPQGRSARSKPLQNCFSVTEMHSLVGRVQNRHKENDLREYHHFCSSI